MLHYSEYGAGEPFIILHGLLGSSENWKTIANKLCHYFNVITIDLRNHGRSFHREEMSYQVMAKDVIELIHHYNWSSPIIMGHSMGAKVALAITDQYDGDIKQLIQIDMVNKHYDNRHLNIINAMEGISIGSYQSRIDLRRILEQEIKDPNILGLVLKNTFQDADRLRWKVNIKAIKTNYNCLIQQVILNDIIEIPTLVIKGELSDYISEQDHNLIKATFSEVTIKTIEGVGHWVHAEAPDRFMEIILNFLECNL